MNLEDFLQILCLTNREESLQRGTALWQKCVTWLKQEVEDEHSEWGAEGIRKYVDVALAKYIETEHSKYA